MLINDVSVPFSATALSASSRDSGFVSVGLPFICVPRIRISEPCRAIRVHHYVSRSSREIWDFICVRAEKKIAVENGVNVLR